MKKKNKTRLKAFLFVVVVILANYIQISYLVIGSPQIIDFRCDAEYIGYQRYKADVNEEITFIYDADFYSKIAIFLGDGTYLDYVEDSTFSHNYTKEGIYNVTLWVLGAGVENFDREWLILEVINDAPEFDIGYTTGEYHDATFDFEDDEIGATPNYWNTYNNADEFFISDKTNIFPGIIIDGTVENLAIEDQQNWNIKSEWTGGDYRYIEMFLKIKETQNHIFTEGQYELFFSANETVSLLGYNPSLGENEIFFNGNYSNGDVITIKDPDHFKLFANFYMEDISSPPEVIGIDWFKLRKVYKGIEIVNDDLGYGKIVKASYGSDSSYCGISQDFNPQKYGTIEFWYKTKNSHLGGVVKFGHSDLDIIQKDEKMFIGTKEITSLDSSIVNNTWYHLRIDFNIEGPQYQGLHSGEGRIFLNEVPSDILLPLGISGINFFKFESNGTAFIDAIGYTWDDDYYIGKNIEKIIPDHLYEDHEIRFSAINLKESNIDEAGFSYEMESELGNKYQYIWDFGDGNYSYEESPIHRFSNEGEFPVRLTLVDDQGAMTTEVKTFVIENRDPQTDIVYGLNYESTYDFKYDITNKAPSDWITHGGVKVVDFKDEFSKVVEIDTTNGGYGMIRIPEPAMELNGSIEFWLYLSDTEQDEFFFWIDKLQSSEENLYVIKNSTRFGFLNGKWMYYYTYTGAGDVVKYAYGEMEDLPLVSNNEWNHIRFDYCWSEELDYQGLNGKEWRVYVNGIPSDIYKAVGNEFNRNGFDIRAGSKIYLESIGFTTDPNYQLGDNNPERKETYYGTWDFRFYPDGLIPFDETLQSTILGPWVFGSYNFERIANNCSASIINDLDGHQKVLELKDNNASDLVFASLIDLSEPTYGTIEFWIRTTDTSQGLVMAFGYEIFHSGIWLGEDGKWWYKSDDEYLEISDVPKMQNNTWHHVRIDFNCSNEKFYFGVDGNFSKLGPFAFDYNVDNFGWNIWSTVNEGYNYSIFIDAIGASWDPSYDIGDNLNVREAIYSDTEIIFSADSTDTKTDKENLRYLWNFGDNQTAFGQTVLHSFSRAGKYKIKLIAIDDNADYEIAEKYIWIDNYYPSINVSNILYGRTSYDFTSDNIGDFPEGWYRSDLEEILGNFTQVVDGIDRFSNIVLIGNGTGVGGIWTSDINGLPFNQTQPGDLNLFNGTIEFWIYTTDVSKSQLYISFFQDTYLDGIFIEFVNGTWKHDGVDIEFESLWTMNSHSWTHFRIDFSTGLNGYMGLGDDEFKIYANGHSSQTLNMIHSTHMDLSNLTCFGIFTQMYQNESTLVFVDNFGLSWDPDYHVGDNQFEYIQYQFKEGETIILDCISYDTYTDYQQLIYNWGNLYMDIGEWEDNGWHYSYTFMNNDDGDELEGYPILSFVGDPLHMWDIDSYYIEVENVDPIFNIHTANVITNITFSIFNDSNDAANFTVYLSSDNLNRTLFEIPYTSDYSGDWISFNQTMVEMLASKEWDIIINQTDRAGGQHEIQLTCEYANGYQYDNSHTFDGVDSIWVVDVDDQWTDSVDQLSLVPMSFIGTIADPSDDKLILEIEYIIQFKYEVSYDTPLLINYTFTVPHSPNDIIWENDIIEETGTKYSISRFKVPIPDSWSTDLMSGSFPVAYDVLFNVDITDVDFYGLINDFFTTESISVLGLESLNYFVEANYSELQYETSPEHFKLGYTISDNYDFKDIGPSVDILTPVNISEDQTIVYYADINDLNGDNVTVNFSFGINDGTGTTYYEAKSLRNNKYGVNYTYTNEGKYLINVIASDGTNETKAIKLIDVENIAPYAKISTIKNVTSEDEYLTFTAELYDTESDVDDLRFFWDFGDGVFSAEQEPIHAYYQAGEYTVKLNVKDNNGASYTATYNITVIDLPPYIYGPFTFVGTEGQTVVLDVDISDSISDFEMNYTWDIYKAIKIYNATYNFMDIDEGDLPGSPFEFKSADNVQYNIIDEFAGHLKVLELYDNNNTHNGSWLVKFGSSTSVNGSIEFWIRSSHISVDEDNFAINLLQYGTGMIPIYIGDNGTWIYKNVFTENCSYIPGIPRLTSNKWHHIRIDYECSPGGYSSLTENTWRISVDGISSPIMNLQLGSYPDDDVSYLDSLQIVSGNPNEMSVYCDAIGYYDGSAKYELGDNINQVFVRYDYVETLSGKKPSAAFEEGSYLINLLVENNLMSQEEIKLEVFAIAPELSVPSKYYYGDTGYIDISAYARDSIIDETNLEFEWYLQDKKVLMESGTQSSTFSVLCNATGLIKGSVLVRDSSELTSSSEFFVNVYMDSNGNGFSNEWEVLNNRTTLDYDLDGLPDFYEQLTTHTNDTLWDTDGDLLSDGFSSDILSGELTIGTDPLDNDTDDDLLFDGFEWFGWNHTLNIHGKTIIANYSSNPKKVDSDGDSLSDYEEYIYKTDPKNPDTDNDLLLDAFELFEYGSNPYIADTDNDGLIDGLEYEIGSYYNVTDTDGDGIMDGAEYHGWDFVSNPLSKDTDHDFLLDDSETHLIDYEIDGRKSLRTPVVLNFKTNNIDKAKSASLTYMITYGETTPEDLLSKFRVMIYKLESNGVLYDEILNFYGHERYFSNTIDIKESIEGNGLSYSGKYVLKVAYASYPHGELTLEDFKIAVNRYLDPSDNDFDDDGIMDGVEPQLLVEGIKTKVIGDINNLTADTNSTTFDKYTLEIDDIGTINDADFYFAIKSRSTLLGTGGVAVKIVQHQLNYHVQDRVIYSSNYTFSTNDDFDQPYHVDIAPYAISPYEYPGKYDLIIDIYSTNDLDVFDLINMRIETDGYRDAGNSDTRAWITRPDMWDSDNDGWSDYYEINRAEQTNPLAWDTDGDGVKDSIDIDPLYDIIIEIKLEEGHVGDLPVWYVLLEHHPNLQMTVSYTYHGKYVAYCSVHRHASKDTERAGKTALSDYKGTSVFDRYHYLNVEDHLDFMKFKVKLWDEGLGGTDVLWDTYKTSHTHNFNLRTNVRDVPKKLKSSGTNWVEYEITKRGVSRANTIAVYKNDTIFNGHYNERDSMHIFQINITGTVPDGRPFVGGHITYQLVEIAFGFEIWMPIIQPGINYLLIPNSVFIYTALNSIIQDEDRLSNSFLSEGEFISLDRENIPTTSSNSIETVFTIECSYSEAMKILNWSMWGVVNETTQELGLVNSYCSTEEHGCRAEMMNLAPDILGTIVAIVEYFDSPQGSMPKDYDQWWADLVEKIVNFFIDLIEFIIDVIVAIIKFVVEAIIFLIQLIITAILLAYIVLIWGISYALTLQMMALIALVLGSAILIGEGIKYTIGLLTDIPYEPWDIEFIYYLIYLYVKWPDVLEVEFDLQSPWVNDEFLGFAIPTTVCAVAMKIPALSIDTAFIVTYAWTGIDIEVEGFPEEDTWEDQTNKITRIFDIIGEVMVLTGAVFSVIGAILAVGEPITGAIAIAAGIAGFVTGLVTFFSIAIISVTDNLSLEETYWGLGFGLLLSGIIGFNPNGYLSKVGKALGKSLIPNTGIFTVGEVLDLVLVLVGARLPSTISTCTISLISGIAATTAGAGAISVVTNLVYKKVVQVSLGIICIGLSAYFLAQAYATWVENEIT